MFIALESFGSFLSSPPCLLYHYETNASLAFFIVSSMQSYFRIQCCIGPTCTDSPSPEALVPNLSYFWIVGAAVTATRKRAVLISIVASMAVGDSTAGVTQRKLQRIGSAILVCHFVTKGTQIPRKRKRVAMC